MEETTNLGPIFNCEIGKGVVLGLHKYDFKTELKFPWKIANFVTNSTIANEIKSQWTHVEIAA